jgi:hypothetical protein
MNVEIGAEAALFPETYIIGIFVAVHTSEFYTEFLNWPLVIITTACQLQMQLQFAVAKCGERRS